MGVMQAADWRRTAGRIACLIALAALLAGCDKCGDWWWASASGEPQACRKEAPKPQ
jgi:hypothetical protein